MVRNLNLVLERKGWVHPKIERTQGRSPFHPSLFLTSSRCLWRRVRRGECKEGFLYGLLFPLSLPAHQSNVPHLPVPEAAHLLACGLAAQMNSPRSHMAMEKYPSVKHHWWRDGERILVDQRGRRGPLVQSQLSKNACIWSVTVECLRRSVHVKAAMFNCLKSVRKQNYNKTQ